MSITLWLSTPSSLRMLPSSLAKPTFIACHALSAYLTPSETSTSQTTRLNAEHTQKTQWETWT